MKKIIYILLITFTSAPTFFSQSQLECEKIVKLVIESFNTKTPEQLEKLYASDFVFANQKGEIAKMVVPTLFKQIKDKITDSKQLEVIQTENLKLIYEFTYSELGKKRTMFVFNDKNQLKEMELFKMEVKTMNSNTELNHSIAESVVIPFKQVGNLIAVEAQLNGNKHWFLLDNGAPKLVLNSVYVKDSVDKNSNQKVLSSAQGVNGSISNVNMALIKKFDFNGITLANQNVLTLPLEHLEKETKLELYGLIGYEIYKNYDLLFDYQSKTITLLQPNYTAAFLSSNFSKNTIDEVSLTMEGHIATIKGTLGNKSLNLGVDCGAESNLISETLKDSLSPFLSRIKTTKLSGADAVSKKVTQARIKNLTIGKKTYPRSKTVFNDMSHLNKGYNIKLDGLVGYEFLSKQKTLLSYVNKKISLIY
jgi:hypothetical protein